MRRSSCPAACPTPPCQRNVLQIPHPPSRGPHPRCPLLGTDPPHPHVAFPALLLLFLPQIPHPSCPGAPGVLPVCHPDIGSLGSSSETSALACGTPQTGNSWETLQPRQRAFSRDFKRSETKSILLHSARNFAVLQGQPFPLLAFPRLRRGMLLLRDAPDLLEDVHPRITAPTLPKFSSECGSFSLSQFGSVPCWLRASSWQLPHPSRSINNSTAY